MKSRALLAISALALLAANAQANGTTANGCTYQVINGKYLYNCEAKSPNTERVPSTQPVEPAAPVAAAPAPQTITIPVAPPTNQTVRNDTVSTISASPEISSTQSPSDAIFVGGHIGAANIVENGDNTTGLGVSISANVDENMGFEFGYTYAKKDVYLGLANRSGAAPAVTPYGTQLKTTDAALTAHLLTGEMQFFLTDYYKRLRPYAGIGLGWKNSSLDEDLAAQPGQMQPNESSLSQSSIGLVASLGTKFHLGKNFLASLAFCAYRPFSTQSPSVNSGGTYALGGPANSSRLTTADSALTEAGMYQIVGGFHVAF